MLCSSRKTPYPPMEGHRKFLGEGDLKAKILEANYEPKLEFPRGRKGGRCKTRNLLWGGVWIFSETAHYKEKFGVHHCSRA